MKIYKYELKDTKNNLSLPIGAEVLSFKMQHGQYNIWVKIDPNQLSEVRNFIIVGTGWDVTENVSYIGTVIDGDFVWHCFETKALV